VIDPTLGSGSTAVAAQRLDRRFVGIDRSEVAIRVARERLAQMKIGVAA
jgi:DNA modification methylase